VPLGNGKRRFSGARKILISVFRQYAHPLTYEVDGSAVLRGVRVVFACETEFVLAAVSVLGTLFFAPRPHRADNDRYTPIEISLERPADASWSPDGKAFTYSALLDGKRQIFVRYLNSPLSTRLTNLASDAKPLGWAPDSQHIFFAGREPRSRRVHRTRTLSSSYEDTSGISYRGLHLGGVGSCDFLPYVALAGLRAKTRPYRRFAVYQRGT
jgi:hypothetical protein